MVFCNGVCINRVCITLNGILLLSDFMTVIISQFMVLPVVLSVWHTVINIPVACSIMSHFQFGNKTRLVCA